MPKFLSGLRLSNDATNPNTVLDIDVGAACSDDNIAMMLLATALTKSTGAWAVGSGNGGLDTGTIAASTWYHVFLIERTDTQIVDALFSTNPAAPTLPTSYTKKRRIGSILTNASSQIIAFTQLGDQFLWTVPVSNYSNIAIGTTVGSVTVTTPLGIKTIAFVSVLLLAPANTSITLQSPDQPYVATSGLASIAAINGQWSAGELQIRTNTSSQCQVAASAAISSGYYQFTKGWIDYRS
jgi:hypothetical protein